MIRQPIDIPDTTRPASGQPSRPTSGPSAGPTALQTYTEHLPIVYGTRRLTAKPVLLGMEYRSLQYNFIPASSAEKDRRYSRGNAQMAILALCEGSTGITTGRYWREDRLCSSDLLMAPVDRYHNVFEGAAKTPSGPVWDVQDGTSLVPWAGLGAETDIWSPLPGVNGDQWNMSGGWMPVGQGIAERPDLGVPFYRTAHIRITALDKEHSFDVPTIDVEVKGVGATVLDSRVAGAYDANPADIIQDVCARAEIPAAETDVGPDGTAASSFRRYCDQMGFAVSRVISESEDALQTIESLLAETNAVMVWSEGRLKLRPLGDVAVGTYVPVTSSTALGLDDFLPDGAELVQVERIGADDAPNSFPVTFGDRLTDYAPFTLSEPDAGDVSLRGLSQADAYSALWITRPAHAQALSSLLAKRSIYVRNRYRFRLPARWCLLEPGDLLSLTEPNAGLTNAGARIVSIEETAGTYAVTAEEWTPAVNHPVVLTTQTADGRASTAGYSEASTGLLAIQAAFSAAALDSDVLDIPAKPAVVAEVDAIEAEYPGIQGAALSVRNAALRTSYVAAHTALSAYLATLTSPGLWSSLTDNTLITRTDFDSKFNAYYSARSVLLTANAALAAADAAAAASAASAAQTTADGAATLAASKTKSFVQATAPTATTVGDMWFDSDDGYRPYRWDGAAWVDVSDANKAKLDLSNAIAGSVASTLLATGAVTAGKLGVELGGGNLLPNSSFEADSDADGMADSWGYYNVGAFNAPARAAGRTGGYCQTVTVVGGVGAPRMLALNRPFVAAGTKVMVSAWMKVTAGLSLFLGVKSYNGAGGETGGPQAVSAVATGAWQRVTAAYTATSDHYVGVTPGLTNTPAAGVVLSVDDVQVETGDVVTAYAPRADELLPGSVTTTTIADGAITTGKLTAGAVTTAKLAAGAVTATEIAAGAIVAGKIGAGVVGATEIAAGAIVANSIAAGAVTAAKLSADSLQTSNYAQADAAYVAAHPEYAVGDATAGAKLDKDGTALKVAANNFKLGAYIFKNFFFRLLNAIDSRGTNDSTDRVWWKGNIDPATNGGAPTIYSASGGDRLAISGENATWANAINGTCSHRVVLNPTAPSDNLDALRYLEVEYWDASSTPVKVATRYFPVCDRKYNNPSSDASCGVVWSCLANMSGVVTQLYHGASPSLFNGTLRVKLHNAYGVSASRDFRSTSVTTVGTALVAGNYTLGGSSGGGGSGGGAGGGGCPAPWVPIRVFDYETGQAVDRQAGSVQMGDLVWTVPETGGDHGWYPVTAVSHEHNRTVRVSMADGRAVEVSRGHRFSVGGTYGPGAASLAVGTIIDGERPGAVASITELGERPVVRITVADAHTYETDGLRGHNAKPVE